MARSNGFIWRLPLATGLILLGGCAHLDGRSTGSEPAASVRTPAGWSSADRALATRATAPEDLAAWWRQLGDPLLDDLIERAVVAAPDARTAQARLRQSRANADLADANLYPSIGLSGSAKRSRTGTDAGGTNTARTLYAAGFDASWEPSIFGGLRDAAAAAQSDSAAVAASLDSVHASLAAEVAINYINLRAAQRRLSIARDNVASQSETLQITEWRAQAGLVTSLDVEQARTNLEQSRASIPSLESARAEAENHLSVLTGEVPGSLRTLLTTEKALPLPPDEIAVGIPADTVRQRPDIRAAESTLQAEIARSAQREAERYPSLTLNGSWGWQAFTTAALGGSGSVVQALAGSLAGNLFDGGRIRSRIEVQIAVQEQALIAYEESLLTAFEDVENALTAYAVGRQRVDSRRKAAVSARNANSLARMLYESGATDFQKFLDTDRTRLTAEDGLASAEADLLTAVIRLYKALGGGWQGASQVSTQEKP